MTILLDNTVLSNFSTIQRPNLIQPAFIEKVATTRQVFQEMEAGVAINKIPACDWNWLEQIRLTSTEQAHLSRLILHLGAW